MYVVILMLRVTFTPVDCLGLRVLFMEVDPEVSQSVQGREWNDSGVGTLTAEAVEYLLPGNPELVRERLRESHTD